MSTTPTFSLGPLANFLDNDRYLLTLKKAADSKERQVVLFRLARQGKDTFYAIESECPHANGPMIDAELEYGDRDIEDIEDVVDSVVAVCPWHGYDFDLVTGESSTGFRACTWKVVVRQSPAAISIGTEDLNKMVVMEGPEGSGDWQVVSVDGVSEAFAESTLPLELPLESPTTLTDWACLILRTADPDQKVALTREALKHLRSGTFSYPEGIVGSHTPPDKPPRPAIRSDVKPAKMGKPGSLRSQLVYLHNITHIEQWAIDLAWDLIARFARPFSSSSQDGEQETMPLAFFEDLANIAEEEAKHFSLLRERLEAKGAFYGQFKTQDGLWDSAEATKGDIKARLSIVCLVHEARGLDVNPAQITKFREADDVETAKVMEIVHADEITHVAAGHRYLTYVCEKEKLSPVSVFRDAVSKHFAGRLRGPFNTDDRAKAGMKEDWYAGDW